MLRGLFMQGSGGTAGTINAPVLNEPAIEWPAQGEEMPEQMGGAPRTVLTPGVRTFKMPEKLAALWHDIEAEDRRQFLPSGQANPTKGQKFKRRQLKFDRNNPLVVVGGADDGAPMLATFSTHPRARGKADDPKTPFISDASYVLDTCLNDKSRPSDPKQLEARINAHGGKTIRLETGLTAQCRPDKVRYIRVVTSSGEQDLPDPTGKKGCGKRYYTKDFKNPLYGAPVAPGQPPEPQWESEIGCDCGKATPEEKARGQVDAIVPIRPFESVERFLPPLGQ